MIAGNFVISGAIFIFFGIEWAMVSFFGMTIVDWYFENQKRKLMPKRNTDFNSLD